VRRVVRLCRHIAGIADGFDRDGAAALPARALRGEFAVRRARAAENRVGVGRAGRSDRCCAARRPGTSFRAMIRQFPLDLRWPPHQRLDAFWPGANVAALQGVSDAAKGVGAWLYLHGASGTGKSHLLIAACRAALEANRSARYVSLVQLAAPRGEALA